MINRTNINDDPTIFYRLVAVWVICEAMLGGIIHGFRIPVSGLVVGSAAVICISLIAWYVPHKGAIFKATIVVAIFKMMLSPQAPPPAYIAVFFQGLTGELFFRNRKYFRISCILFAIIALLESGLQRILVLTIVYGNDLWVVVNDFLNKLTKQKTTTNYSLWIGIGYVGLHLLTGMLVGSWMASLPKKMERWKVQENWVIKPASTSFEILHDRTNRKRRIRTGMLIIWTLLVVLYVQSYYKIGTPLLPAHVSLKILLRSLIIILAWIFIISPLLKKFLYRSLEKRKTAMKEEIAAVLHLLPSTRQMLAAAWYKSAGHGSLKRIGLFARIAFLNILYNEQQPGRRIYILTGAIGAGKTTALMNWAKNRNDVRGILSPVVNGQRVFFDLATSEQFAMQANESETNVLKVGRFVFSKESFVKAEAVIRNAIHQPGWLLIDEIGPMELRGEGFYKILQEVLEKRNEPLLLVVREEMATEVNDFFKINALIIRDAEQAM